MEGECDSILYRSNQQSMINYGIHKALAPRLGDPVITFFQLAFQAVYNALQRPIPWSEQRKEAPPHPG